MTHVYTRIFALGAVCGMRTMLGPALVARQSSQTAQIVFGLLAVGEFVGDKLPQTPDRISAGGLFGRIMSAAIVGIILSRRAGQSPVGGVIFGIAGALSGSYGGYYGRKAVGTALHVPDPVIAVGEDMLALTVGRCFAQ